MEWGWGVWEGESVCHLCVADFLFGKKEKNIKKSFLIQKNIVERNTTHGTIFL